MMDKTALDQVRKEAQDALQILIPRDDPIMGLVALNDALVRRYAEDLAEQGVSHQLALTALLTEQEKRAKEASGKIITGAADYVAGQIRNTVQPVLKETVDTVRGLLGNAQAHAAETQDHVASAQAALVAAQALRRSSAVLAVVTVLAAAVAVAATLVAVTH